MSQTLLMFFVHLPPGFDGRRELCKHFHIPEEEITVYILDTDYQIIYFSIQSERIYTDICNNLIGSFNLLYNSHITLRGIVLPAADQLRVLQITSSDFPREEMLKEALSAYGTVHYVSTVYHRRRGRFYGLVLTVRNYIPYQILLNSMLLKLSANLPYPSCPHCNNVIWPQEGPPATMSLPMWFAECANFRGRGWHRLSDAERRAGRRAAASVSAPEQQGQKRGGSGSDVEVD